jgi:leucyl aminopeptidase
VSTTLSIGGASPHLVGADAVVVAVMKGNGGPLPGPGSKDVDDALGGTLAQTLATLGATGDAGEVTKIAAGQRLAAPLLVAVGTGAGTDRADTAIDPEALRRAAGAAVRALIFPPGAGGPSLPGGGRHRRIALALPARDQAEAEAVALGALLGAYVFQRYRREPAGDTELILLAQGDHAGEAAARARVLANAVNLVRDLVNAAPSDLVPDSLAEHSRQVAADSGLTATVLDERDLADGGYGAILGVGQGSAHPPRLVRLEHAPPGATKTLVLGGKGVTFDSGGLSLKPAKSMEAMKSDMAGAAAVLGAMQAIAALRLPVRVVGYLPLVENMPGGTAQRPSDVLVTYGGITVEVTNTDAEGRLILADVLARSAEDSPDVLVDVASLTGSQIVALGPLIGAVMSNDGELSGAVVDAARRAGEMMWPMPLPPELRPTLDSSVADLVNLGPDRNGGMLVAGLFLREFVPAGVAWAHLDIAGPSFNTGQAQGYTPVGGTGAAVRTLVQIAADMAEGRL